LSTSFDFRKSALDCILGWYIKRADSKRAKLAERSFTAIRL
jgi:hypothetical protein